MKVVGTDDGGIAPHVAEPERAFLEHCDVADAVLGGEIERGREPVAAAAHDHDPVAGARAGLGPGARPAALTGDSFAQDSPEGIAATGAPYGTSRRARLGCTHCCRHHKARACR